MFCPLKEITIRGEICPVKCMYRRRNGSCGHNDLAFEDGLSEEEIAEVLKVNAEDVKRLGAEGKRRIRVAMVIDSYLGYANRGMHEVGKNEHPIFKLFNLPRNKLKSVFSRKKYDAWKELSKVDVTFDEIKSLFLSALKEQGAN